MGQNHTSTLSLVFITSLSIILALIFYFFPAIDLYFSSLFYTHEEGFLHKDNPIIYVISKMAHAVGLICIAVPIFSSIKSYLRKKNLKYNEYKNVVYVILVCLLGPVITAHYISKDYFSRARPEHIYQFGGNAQFSAAFAISNQCSEDCSFVSGHAAAGFSIFALAFITPKKRNRFIINTLAIIVGLLIGFARIASGRHFLSDILFAGVMVYLISYLISKVMRLEGDEGRGNTT